MYYLHEGARQFGAPTSARVYLCTVRLDVVDDGAHNIIKRFARKVRVSQGAP